VNDAMLMKSAEHSGNAVFGVEAGAIAGHGT
jgi:hypothetical protein